MNEKVKVSKNYPWLDFTQYAASLLVIFIHCDRLLSNEVGHFYLKNVLCRLAVPIFFIISGFFYKERQKAEPHYYKRYFCRQMKQYLFWSLLYLPYGLSFLFQQSISPVLYPVALFVGLFYVGICYHLWYIPALLFGLWFLEYLHKKMSYWLLGMLTFLLYILGSFETYSKYLEGSVLASVYTTYKGIFITTRNGLFYALIFLLLGFLLSEFKERKFFTQYLGIKIIGSSLLLMLEGWFVFQQPGDDKNFLFMLIPVSLFIVTWAQQSLHLTNRNWYILRVSSKYMYFLHPFLLELSKYTAFKLGMGKFQGLPLFMITFVLTSSVTLGILASKRNDDVKRQTEIYKKIAVFKIKLYQKTLALRNWLLS